MASSADIKAVLWGALRNRRMIVLLELRSRCLADFMPDIKHSGNVLVILPT